MIEAKGVISQITERNNIDSRNANNHSVKKTVLTAKKRELKKSCTIVW